MSTYNPDDTVEFWHCSQDQPPRYLRGIVTGIAPTHLSVLVDGVTIRVEEKDVRMQMRTELRS